MGVVLFITVITVFFVFSMNIKRNRELAELNRKFKLQTIYFEELLKNSQDGIVILDNEDKIVNVNESFEKIFQYKLEEIKDLFANDVIACPDMKDAFQFSDIIMHGGTINSETKRKRKDGVLIDVNIIAFPFILDTNQVGLCAIYKDIDNEKKSEQKLHLQTLYFNQLLENSPEAICVVDMQDRITDVNPAFEKLFQYTKEELKNHYINDIVVQNDAIQEAVNISETVLNGNVMKCETIRIKKDRSLINVQILAHPIFFENKQIGVFLIYTDITEQKRSQEVLKASEYTFRTLFENSSDAVFILEDGDILDCNTAAVELLGYNSKISIIGKKPYEISPEGQPNGDISKSKQEEILKKANENVKVKFEWWNKKKDGTLLPVEVMVTAILLDGKKVFHCLCRDISERKHMEHKLKCLSYHDQLTGLYNRRVFQKELKIMDIKDNLPLTIVMADVNGLKLINDSFGHVMGDELVKKASQAIKRGFSNKDFIARIGGDEFIILMPKTDNKEAEGIIRHVENIVLEERVNSVCINIAFGYATKINEKENIEEVLKEAEDNMYRKKLFESPNVKKRTIDCIMKALYKKSEKERGHSYRVSELCKDMGIALNLSEKEIENLKALGLFHDIGKIVLEEDVLNKREKFTRDEWNKIKCHPEIGYRILNTVSDTLEIAQYVLAHHEKWNGSGHPKCLKREEIPLQSRIIAIVDAYDHMINPKRHEYIMTRDMAVEELKKNAGTYFDPKLVQIFIEKVVHN